MLYDYFTIEHIMCIYTHREYEGSPICNFPMILIFISSLFSVKLAMAADLWHLSERAETAN